MLVNQGFRGDDDVSYDKGQINFGAELSIDSSSGKTVLCAVVPEDRRSAIFTGVMYFVREKSFVFYVLHAHLFV